MVSASPGRVPVVALGSTGDPVARNRARRTGVSLVSVADPENVELLERDLRLALERLRLRRALEDTKSRLETELRTDPLTTALNRRGLQEVLDAEVERSRRSQSDTTALLLDLDDFKRVNDLHGLTAGDRVLVEAVERIRRSLRRTDHVSRVGGDEFVIVLPETRSGEARMLAEKIRLAIASRPFAVGEESVRVTASLGLVPLQEPSIESILTLGHPLLTLSKGAGKDRVTVAPDESPRKTAQPLSLVIQALDRPGAMAVRAAPIVRVRDREIVGHELFVRSSFPGFESPVDFFRVAAEAKLLSRIDLRCFAACCAARQHLPPGRQIHLNLNPITLVEAPLSDLLRLLDGSGVGHEIFLDLSETQIVGDPSYLQGPIAQLRRAGVKIALDDGELASGCLESLILIQPAILKLRPRLLLEAGATRDPVHRLQRLVILGRRMGAAVLCEGVETEGHLELLAEVGVDLAEGPYWPMRDLTTR